MNLLSIVTINCEAAFDLTVQGVEAGIRPFFTPRHRHWRQRSGAAALARSNELQLLTASASNLAKVAVLLENAESLSTFAVQPWSSWVPRWKEQ